MARNKKAGICQREARGSGSIKNSHHPALINLFKKASEPERPFDCLLGEEKHKSGVQILGGNFL